jgi:single-strand DNA-binding protein
VNDAQITVVGNLTAEPRYLVTNNGTPLLSLRLASTPRRYDRETGMWRDGDTMFMTVTCWRALAANGQESLTKGDPVVVTGRLRLREYERDGQRRLSAEIEATTVGHDLSRGVARFDRTRRSSGASAEDRKVASRIADIWESTDPTDVTGDGAAAARDGGQEDEGAATVTLSDGPSAAEGAGEAGDGRPDAGGGGAGDSDHPADRSEPGPMRAAA